MMNIKRMPSCIAVVVAALLLAVSCGNMLEAPKAEGVEGGMGRLSVSMGDGRAVFPEELKFEEDKELTFTLSGSLSGGEGKEIRSWSAEGDKTAHQVMVADTSLTVEAGRWSFTLQAKRGGTVVATASKDLEVKGGTTNRLSFGTMAYSDEGTGTVTVTISWNEVERVTSVVAGLYNASNDTMVSGTEVTFGTIEGAQVTYTKSGVPAGIYRLKAQMYQDDAVIGTYSELVRVAGGLSSEAERELGSLNTQYTVTFNANGGTGTMDSQTFISGVEQELSANAFERENYTFSGWSEDKAADAATYTDKAMFTATKDTPLYAVWEANVTIAIEGSTATITIPDDAKDTRVQNAVTEALAGNATLLMINDQLTDAQQTAIATALTGKSDIALVMGGVTAPTTTITELAAIDLAYKNGTGENAYAVASDGTHIITGKDGLDAWNTAATSDVSTNLTLACDIEYNANWSRLKVTYNGTINGNGYAIIGLNCSASNNAGFIYGLGGEGVIKYLGIVGGSFSNSKSINGCGSHAFVSNNYGVIMGCYNTSSCTSAGGSEDYGNASGISTENESSGKIIACYNAGTISAGGASASGISGGNSGLISGCYNTGAVSTKGGDYGYDATAITSANRKTINDCYYTQPSRGYENDSNTATATNITNVAGSDWTDAMNAMNAAIEAYNADEANTVKCNYRYVLNTDAATKEAQPLVIVEAPATE